MKPVIFVLVVALLLVPARTVVASASPPPAMITLTADQVISAIDIENAERQVTSEGKRPGVIVLDGRKGPFLYDHPDRSINIFFSDLTLRGVNNAYFPNSEGIYIDGDLASRLVIEGLAMRCSGDCVGGVGIHNQITVRNNLFQAGGGIGIAQGKGHVITGNTILSRNDPVFLTETQNVLVTGNHLSAVGIGVMLNGARSTQVRGNSFSGGWQGVLLKSGAYGNIVTGNSMVGIQNAGVAFEAEVYKTITANNRVLCAPDSNCVVFNDEPIVRERNSFPVAPLVNLKSTANRVVLTAEDVTNAVDIEFAIEKATQQGTHPGTVVLDGRDGPFVLTGLDRSINIAFSNLSVWGINNAAITGCDDAFFFDNVPADNILIRDLSLDCYGDGIDVIGSHQNVRILNNLIRGEMSGINMDTSQRYWTIMKNTIQSPSDALRMPGIIGGIISGNHLSGSCGVLLFSATRSHVFGNAIRAQSQGVLLGQEAWNNNVSMNSILGVMGAGIALEPDVTRNRVMDNLVACAFDSACQTVAASPELMASNIILRNRP